MDSSVGISWTKFLAKFASDIAPKKSILIIKNKKELESILDGRELKDAWGINVKTEMRLKMFGINNLLDLKNYDKNRIRKILGRWGYYLWANVNGEEVTRVERGSRQPKSVGHSYSLAKRTKEIESLKVIFYKLCEKTGRRLRDMELEAQNISIGMAYTRDGGIFRSFKTPEKMFTTEEIFKYVERFLDNTPIVMPVRVASISVGRLSDITNQMSMFEDNLSKKELSRALDKVNNKYGEYTVVRGQMFNTDDIARDRIGFRKIT